MRRGAGGGRALSSLSSTYTLSPSRSADAILSAYLRHNDDRQASLRHIKADAMVTSSRHKTKSLREHSRQLSGSHLTSNLKFLYTDMRKKTQTSNGESLFSATYLTAQAYHLRPQRTLQLAIWHSFQVTSHNFSNSKRRELNSNHPNGAPNPVFFY